MVKEKSALDTKGAEVDMEVEEVPDSELLLEEGRRARKRTSNNSPASGEPWRPLRGLRAKIAESEKKHAQKKPQGGKHFR
eukprot:12001509-Alexandrium_andersonii.AAC.1